MAADYAAVEPTDRYLTVVPRIPLEVADKERVLQAVREAARAVGSSSESQ